jgi:hypothetical protein
MLDVRPAHPVTAMLMLAAAVTACSTTAPVRGAFPGGAVAPRDAIAGAPRFMAHPPTQCVPYARALSGVDIRGDANTWWGQAGALGYRQSERPTGGAVMVLQSSGLGHVAVVTRVISDRVVLVDHANWHGRGEVAVGVPVRDVSPDNSWRQVNVWWLDTNQWGATNYSVEGFILPR